MSVFKGTKGFYQYDVHGHVAQNIKSWLEYGLLELGGFTQITFNSAASGYTNLKKVPDPRYALVFEALGPMVWESGVTVITGEPAPFAASGIYIDNSFTRPSTGTAPNDYIIDYKNGRIIFGSGLNPSNATVKCEYTMKDVSVYLTSEPEWRRLVEGYTDKFENLETLSPSGMAQILRERRVKIPCIFIESEDISSDGLQLGGGEIARCQVRYHIFSDTAFAAQRITDIIIAQDEKTLDFYNVNTAPFALKSNGSLPSGIQTYPQLANRSSPYFWTYAVLEETTGGTQDDYLDLYRAECRQVVAVYRYNSTY